MKGFTVAKRQCPSCNRPQLEQHFRRGVCDTCVRNLRRAEAPHRFRTGGERPDPTVALPGTDEKLEVMAERAAAKQAVTDHDLDADMSPPTLPFPPVLIARSVEIHTRKKTKKGQSKDFYRYLPAKPTYQDIKAAILRHADGCCDRESGPE